MAGSVPDLDLRKQWFRRDWIEIIVQRDDIMGRPPCPGKHRTSLPPDVKRMMFRLDAWPAHIPLSPYDILVNPHSRPRGARNGSWHPLVPQAGDAHASNGSGLHRALHREA